MCVEVGQERGLRGRRERGERAGQLDAPPPPPRSHHSSTNWRCASVHGTNAVTLYGNVGFNITGHCYYLEGGPAAPACVCA